MKKRGGPTGMRRADRSRYPYEPRIVEGKLMTPVDLQRLHRFVLDTAVIEVISDDMRTVVETLWPELVGKLPPKKDALQQGTLPGRTPWSDTGFLGIAAAALASSATMAVMTKGVGRTQAHLGQFA
jgi:hypothetical protein